MHLSLMPLGAVLAVCLPLLISDRPGPGAGWRSHLQAQALGTRCIVPNGPICMIPPAPMGSQCFCNGLIGFVAP
ncbi:hypothetical protein LXM94_07845 [Rhizobium sp. TRM95111]|uniref:hypothetical protein n=1 Tax=Rhizobium alarense TaxID=2846851 RepID=UPI001F2BE183|nr:hypothetical protein [Rhizobium alarense]MCF3639879.1 hypothetical protein [Rhizobium alarense]